MATSLQTAVVLRAAEPFDDAGAVDLLSRMVDLEAHRIDLDFGDTRTFATPGVSMLVTVLLVYLHQHPDREVRILELPPVQTELLSRVGVELGRDGLVRIEAPQRRTRGERTLIAVP